MTKIPTLVLKQFDQILKSDLRWRGVGTDGRLKWTSIEQGYCPAV